MLKTIRVGWAWVVVCLSLVACVHHDFSGRAIRQGNLSASPSKLRQLHAGMTKQQVVSVMGTSLIKVLFDHRRWDYAYWHQQPNQPPQVHTASLYFDANGRLAKVVSK